MKTVTLDGLAYAILEGTTIQMRSRPVAADPLRLNAQIERKDFGLYQQLPLTGPLEIGLRSGSDLSRCQDQYNVIAWWPGQLTRGPQKVTATFTGSPTTYKVQSGAGFIEAFDKLFMYGAGTGAASDEPVWYLLDTTWTDSTLNADVGADMVKVTGMVAIAGVLYAVGEQLLSNGTVNRITYRATAVTTWAEEQSDAAAETIPNNRLSFMEDGSKINVSGAGWTGTPYLLSLAWASAGNTVNLAHRTSVRTVLWTASNVTAINVSSSAEPRGLIIYPDPDGAPGVYASTRDGLWWWDVSVAAAIPVQVVKYYNITSVHTGKLLLHKEWIYFTDGPNIGRFRWIDNNKTKLVQYLGPEWRNDIQEWDGIVIGKTGDVTGLAASQAEPDVIYVAKGGLAASRNACIWRFQLDPVGRGRWYIPYMGGTAQRAIMGLYESPRDQEVTRLHFMEEQAAGGDQDPFFMGNLQQNPLSNTSFAYNASGTVVDAERRGLSGLTPVGWMAIQVDADDLSATKKITVRDGQNGAAPGGAQDIVSTTSPAQVWPDKTDASAGVGVSAKRQQIEFDLVDSAANSTVGPTIKEISITQLIKGLLPGATTAREIEFVVDLDASGKLSTRQNPKIALTDLQTTEDKLTLVPLIIGETTFQVTVKLGPVALQPQPQSGVQQAPSGGTAVVIASQLLR